MKTAFLLSRFTVHGSRLFVLRRIIDDFDGARADALRVEGDGAVAVFLDGAVLSARGLFQSLARLDADAYVLRVLRAGRQQGHAEAARVAHHRPVFIHRLDAEAQSLVLSHVRAQVLRPDRDVIYKALDAQTAPLLHDDLRKKSSKFRVQSSKFKVVGCRFEL